MGHYLIVQPWSPRFDSSKEKIESIIAWIRLPGMALYYYHKRVLRMLGQVIGKVIWIDYNTKYALRGKFARIVVEVTFSKPLVSQFLLNGKVRKVENVNLPNICFGCGKYGHSCESCPDRVVTNDTVGKKKLSYALKSVEVMPEKGAEDGL